MPLIAADIHVPSAMPLMPPRRHSLLLGCPTVMTTRRPLSPRPFRRYYFDIIIDDIILFFVLRAAFPAYYFRCHAPLPAMPLMDAIFIALLPTPFLG